MPLDPDQVERNRQRLAPFDLNRAVELYEVQRDAVARFQGDFDELESALGLLQLGDHTGWRPLVLIHNKRTIRKYEAILGITLREFFPEEGPSADRSYGYKLVKKIGSFWKAVSGELNDPDLKSNRRVID